MDTFEFWFRVAWVSLAVVLVLGFAAFSWEVWHAPELPDDGHGN